MRARLIRLIALTLVLGATLCIGVMFVGGLAMTCMAFGRFCRCKSCGKRDLRQEFRP